MLPARYDDDDDLQKTYTLSSRDEISKYKLEYIYIYIYIYIYTMEMPRRKNKESKTMTILRTPKKWRGTTCWLTPGSAVVGSL